MAPKISNRSNIETFRVLDTLRLVNERLAAGENIIRLEAGQPCFGAPKAVIDKVCDILQANPQQGYTDALGMMDLRKRIARHYQDTYGVAIDHSRVGITVGSSAGMIMAFVCAFEAGDKVAINVPTYPAYKNILNSLDIEVVEIETTAETNYQPTLELLENCGEKLDGVIINSPSNPTGTMIDDSEFETICNWCDANKIRLFSDEAYHGITYEQPAKTALSYSDNAVILNTFSKYFAMTGWRLGWVVLPENMAANFKKLAENWFVSPPTPAQFAALEVFNHSDELNAYVDVYRENRDILMEELPKIGIDKISQAKGAFYLYADIGHLTNDSEEFSRRALTEAKTSFTSGVDFDAGRGHRTIRISYAGSPEHMREACARLKEWLA